jgi:hypothetical protein
MACPSFIKMVGRPYLGSTINQPDTSWQRQLPRVRLLAHDMRDLLSQQACPAHTQFPLSANCSQLSAGSLARLVARGARRPNDACFCPKAGEPCHTAQMLGNALQI